MRIRIEFKDKGYYPDGRKRHISKKADRFLARFFLFLWIAFIVFSLVYIIVMKQNRKTADPFNDEVYETRIWRY